MSHRAAANGRLERSLFFRNALDGKLPPSLDLVEAGRGERAADMDFFGNRRVRKAARLVEKTWSQEEPDLAPLRALGPNERARAFLALAESRLDALHAAEVEAEEEEEQKQLEARTREYADSPALRVHVRRWRRERARGALPERDRSFTASGKSTRGVHRASRLGPPPAVAPLLKWSRAFLEEALRLQPDLWDAHAALAELESGPWGLRERALVSYTQLHGLDPQNQRVRAELCIHLLDAGRIDEARSHFAHLGDLDHLEQGLRLAESLCGADCLEEALEWLTGLERAYRLELMNTFDTPERKEVVAQYERLQRLLEETSAEVSGREASVLHAAEAGGLDARAGVNYALLGEALLLESDLAPDAPELRTAQEEDERGRLLSKQGQAARGAGLRGSAALRQGMAEQAETWFRHATASDGGFWPALLGMGAAMIFQEQRSAALVESLPALPLPADLPQLLPSWPALTSPERRVVLASFHPFRRFLPRLARRGCRVVILPFDAKPTLLPELRALAHPGQARTEDHRHYEAIGGLANETLAVVRVIDLLHLGGPSGWTLAHELAHLVFENHRQDLGRVVGDHYARASSVGFVMDHYGAKNVHEFFAVSYTDYLRHRYGLPLEKEPDEEGVMTAIFRWYDDLAAD